MQATRWLLLFFVLLAPLAVGCGGGGEAGPAGAVDDAEAHFAANPEDAQPAEEVVLESGPGL